MNSNSEKPQFDENGLIKRICMKPKCNQPLWVREYIEYTPEFPLLCPDCWRIVYNCRDIKLQEFSVDKNWSSVDYNVREKCEQDAIRDWINKGKENDLTYS